MFCGELQLLERAKEIKILKNQPNVFLTEARIRVIPDWLIYRVRSNEEIYIDFKGYDGQSWLRNRKLWKFYGPRPMEVWRRNGNRFVLSETIIPRGGDKRGEEKTSKKESEEIRLKS